MEPWRRLYGVVAVTGAHMLLAVALTWAYVRSKSPERAQEKQWRESVPVNGTDFQGTIWDRLDGTDLLAARWEDRNLVHSTNADPGKVGRAQLGLEPSWNGSL